MNYKKQIIIGTINLAKSTKISIKNQLTVNSDQLTVK